ncbi:MAG: hypothetical protein V1751_10615, partial [Pseudomonadota bacterium]
AFPSIIRFFGSGLFRHDQVSAGYAENSLLLHGRYDMCLEPFRRQRNLYDMCALPSGCFQQIQIIIDENSTIRRLRQCRCMLKIPPIRIDKGKPCRLFGMLRECNGGRECNVMGDVATMPLFYRMGDGLCA